MTYLNLGHTSFWSLQFAGSPLLSNLGEYANIPYTELEGVENCKLSVSLVSICPGLENYLDQSRVSHSSGKWALGYRGIIYRFVCKYSSENTSIGEPYVAAKKPFSIRLCVIQFKYLQTFNAPAVWTILSHHIQLEQVFILTTCGFFGYLEVLSICLPYINRGNSFNLCCYLKIE